MNEDFILRDFEAIFDMPNSRINATKQKLYDIELNKDIISTLADITSYYLTFINPVISRVHIKNTLIHYMQNKGWTSFDKERAESIYLNGSTRNENFKEHLLNRGINMNTKSELMNFITDDELPNFKKLKSNSVLYYYDLDFEKFYENRVRGLSAILEP
ncbi:hypothetical protein K9L97_05895 [Candidatus Woesearchaeota archaeon]|nr:hypothetical protein [Candidatus Woesearchaeota archaeon]